LGYHFYFLPDKINEPLHVYVSKNDNYEESTKILVREWVPNALNNVKVANRHRDISKEDLDTISRFVTLNQGLISNEAHYYYGKMIEYYPKKGKNRA
jgi:hypothetical protein